MKTIIPHERSLAPCGRFHSVAEAFADARNSEMRWQAFDVEIRLCTRKRAGIGESQR